MAVTGGTYWESTARLVGMAGVFAGVILIVLTVLHVPMPGWWAPAWFRKLSAQERLPNAADAFSAAIALSEIEPKAGSTELFAARTRNARVLNSWHANHVYDPDSTARAHGLAGRGMVAGSMILLEDRVMFYASELEDTLRGEPTVLEIDFRAITNIRVVPPRAGSDGVPRPGRLHRSLLPRLAICSDTQDYVFEVARARRTVEEIEAVRAAARR